MNELEALYVAETRLDELREQPYERLVDDWLDQPRSEYASSPSGRRYNLEIEAVWDSRPGRELRVWVLVDSGGKSEKRPLQRDFIVRPDGSFVGARQ